MRFLIDANMPRATRTALLVAGYESVDVRDVGMRTARDEQIAQHAKGNSLTIITRDRGFANSRKYPPKEYSGIVVINLPFEATAREVISVVREFIERADMIEQLPAKTVVVSKDRVQMRSS